MSCILALGLWITFKNAKSKALQVHYYIYSKDIIRQWTVHQLIPWSSFKTWEANFLQIKGQENLFSSLEKLVFPPTPILPPHTLKDNHLAQCFSAGCYGILGRTILGMWDVSPTPPPTAIQYSWLPDINASWTLSHCDHPNCPHTFPSALS